MKEATSMQIHSALGLVDEELTLHRSGAGRVSNEAQLQLIKEKLFAMLIQVESGNLPLKQERIRGIGRMVADSWPFDSELGSVLLDVEQSYLQM